MSLITTLQGASDAAQASPGTVKVFDSTLHTVNVETRTIHEVDVFDATLHGVTVFDEDGA